MLKRTAALLVLAVLTTMGCRQIEPTPTITPTVIPTPTPLALYPPAPLDSSPTETDANPSDTAINGAALMVEGPTALTPLRLGKGRPSTMALSADGAWLAVGGPNSLTLYDTESLAEQWSISNRYTPTDMAFSPDGSVLAFTDAADHLLVIDRENGIEFMTHDLPVRNDHAFAFHPDGNHIVLIGYTSNQPRSRNALLAMMNIYSGDLNWQVRTQGYRRAVLSISPDGSKVATATWLGQALIFDVDSGQPLESLDGQFTNMTSLNWSSDSELLTAGYYFEDTTITWRVGRLDPDGKQEAGDTRVWSPDGSRLAISRSDGSVRIQNVADPDEDHRLVGHESSVVEMVWAQPNLLVTRSWDGLIILWNPITGQMQHRLSNHTRDKLWSTAVAPDGLIAAGTESGSVQLWDPSIQQRLSTWHGHNQPVIELAFSADGRWLASGQPNGRVVLWNRASGMATAQWEPEQLQYLSGLAWHDSQLLIVTSRLTLHWDPDAALEPTIFGSSADNVTDFDLVSANGDLPSQMALSIASPEASRNNFLANSLVLISLTPQRERVILRNPNLLGFRQVAWSADGSMIAVSDEGNLIVWEVATRQIVHHEQNVGLISHLGWTADNGAVLFSRISGEYLIGIDIATGGWRYLEGHSSPISAITLDVARDRLITASHDGTLLIWPAHWPLGISAEDQFE
ncbi:MAG: hypothetical protein GYB68_19445 [Chloroflexi bacterium]|nr:hypothetical protein [Chloroflexota bacterium]